MYTVLLPETPILVSRSADGSMSCCCYLEGIHHMLTAGTTKICDECEQDARDYGVMYMNYYDWLENTAVDDPELSDLTFEKFIRIMQATEN